MYYPEKLPRLFNQENDLKRIWLGFALGTIATGSLLMGAGESDLSAYPIATVVGLSLGQTFKPLIRKSRS
jgi:hypothetical protein